MLALQREPPRRNEEPKTCSDRTWFKGGVLALLAVTAFCTLVREKYVVNEVMEPVKMRSAVPVEYPKKPIKQVSILGERNSGTRWTFAHLTDCFGDRLEVRRRLTRYKHWFQYNDTSKYLKDTIVVAQFRNPYDWIEAMHQVPHHCPAHLDLDWKEFCTKEWTTERVGLDLNITDMINPICQQDFRYKDIVSCERKPLPNSAYKHKLRASENQPFYEMRNDGSGKPYANIMEMRSDKIRNFLGVKEYEGVRDVWVIQYEQLLADGTKGMLDRIAKLTGVDYNCTPYEGQNRRRRPILRDFVQFLNQHLDWETEALVGYTKYVKGEQTRLNIVDSLEEAE